MIKIHHRTLIAVSGSWADIVRRFALVVGGLTRPLLWSSSVVTRSPVTLGRRPDLSSAALPLDRNEQGLNWSQEALQKHWFCFQLFCVLC